MSPNELPYANSDLSTDTSIPRPLLRYRLPLIVILVTAIAFAILLFLVPPTLWRLFAIFFLPPIAGIATGVWWVAQRNVRWSEKGLTLAALVVGAVIGGLLGEKLTKPFVMIWGLPLTGIAVVLFAAAVQQWGNARPSRAMVATVAVAAFLPWLVIRTNGQQGEGMITFAPRWSVSREQRLLDWVKSSATTRPTITAAELTVTDSDWPAFRGPDRNNVVPGVEMRFPGAGVSGFTPVAKWRHPVGVGWSSFAVVGNFAYTQEQRGTLECIVCYDVRTGQQVWVHTEDNHFNEMSGGPGPRATPAFADGKLFTFGPTGILTCVDAATGVEKWKRSLVASNAPQWGFASSPVVADGKVIVGPSGAGGVKLAAFDAATGNPAWAVPDGMAGYSSPVIGTVCGVKQLVFLDGDGASAHSIKDGKLLWQFSWQTKGPKSAVPCFVDDSTILLGMSYYEGLRLIKISRDGDQWSVALTWQSKKMMPKFNDMVTRNGYAYGLDEGALTCVKLSDGTRAWRGEHYGFGQILLVGSHLLVLAESGEVAIVDAKPDKFNEIARFQAIEGKTWAHPVLVRGNLLVRNSDEAACYDLSPWLIRAAQ